MKAVICLSVIIIIIIIIIVLFAVLNTKNCNVQEKFSACYNNESAQTLNGRCCSMGVTVRQYSCNNAACVHSLDLPKDDFYTNFGICCPYGVTKNGVTKSRSGCRACKTVHDVYHPGKKCWCDAGMCHDCTSTHTTKVNTFLEPGSEKGGDTAYGPQVCGDFVTL